MLPEALPMKITHRVASRSLTDEVSPTEVLPEALLSEAAPVAMFTGIARGEALLNKAS